MVLLLLASFVLGGYFLIRWMNLRKSLLRLKKEWKSCQSKGTNRLLPEVSSDPVCKELVRELNSTLRDLKKERFELDKQKRFFFTQTANAAHDFKTPLAAALGYLQLAEYEDSPAQKEKDLSIVRERLLRLKDISADLFDFASLQDPDHPILLSHLSLSSHLEEAVLALYPLFKQKGIEPLIYSEDCFVLANPQAIDQVFANLLSNALKYSRDKTISIHLTEPGEVRFKNAVEGLYWSDVEKVFERYYSVGQNNSSHGLGLGIAKALMEKMGGTLSVSFEYGEIEFCCRFQPAEQHLQKSIKNSS